MDSSKDIRKIAERVAVAPTVRKIEDLLKVNKLPEEFIYNGVWFSVGGSSGDRLEDYFGGKKVPFISFYSIGDDWKGKTPKKEGKIVYQVNGQTIVPSKITWGSR